jgi:hypothetical protein
MVGIQFFATPIATATPHNGIVTTTYHVANLYRGRERYKVWFTTGLEGSRWGVTGHNKPTGFEPFCLKWAERFKKIAGLISWGYSWNGYTFTNSIEEEMCKYCDRLQIITCYPKQDEMEVLMSLHRSHGKSSYSYDYILMKTSARQGWTKTINVK